MRLIALSMARTQEGLEMRARYAYDPAKPPRKPEVEGQVEVMLRNALTLLEHKQMEKVGIQREDMKEEKATMTLIQYHAGAKGGKGS